MIGMPDYDSTPPKMSPRGGIPDRGSRSPAVARNEPSSSGTLKLNISLGKNPSVIHSGPFYCLKEPPEQEKLTGESNLIAEYNLEHAYQKFNGKKRHRKTAHYRQRNRETVHVSVGGIPAASRPAAGTISAVDDAAAGEEEAEEESV